PEKGLVKPPSHPSRCAQANENSPRNGKRKRARKLKAMRGDVNGSQSAGAGAVQGLPRTSQFREGPQALAHPLHRPTSGDDADRQRDLARNHDEHADLLIDRLSDGAIASQVVPLEGLMNGERAYRASANDASASGSATVSPAALSQTPTLPTQSV